MIYRFRFWHEWCDNDGRLWAEPFEFESSQDARRAHKGALGWDWVGDRLRPSVSDLVSVAYVEDPQSGKKREQNRTIIQDGAAREFHEATLSGLRQANDRKPMPTARDTSRAFKEPDGADTPF